MNQEKLDEVLFRFVNALDTDDLRSYVLNLLKQKWYAKPVQEQEQLINQMNGVA